MPHTNVGSRRDAQVHGFLASILAHGYLCVCGRIRPSLPQKSDKSACDAGRAATPSGGGGSWDAGPFAKRYCYCIDHCCMRIRSLVVRLWNMAVETEMGNLTHALRPRATLRASIEKHWTAEQRGREAKFQSSTGNRGDLFVGLDGGMFYVSRERVRIHPRDFYWDLFGIVNGTVEAELIGKFNPDIEWVAKDEGKFKYVASRFHPLCDRLESNSIGTMGVGLQDAMSRP